MKHIKDYKFKKLFDQIESKSFADINDSLWEMIKWDGWINDKSRYKSDEKGYKKDDYEYIELDIPEIDEFGLVTADDKTIDKYNEFDIQLKDRYYKKGYIDFIDYDNGKVYVVRIK